MLNVVCHTTISGHFHGDKKFRLIQSWTKIGLDFCSVLDNQIYEMRMMRCLFVTVGHNALFIVLPHWDNMS